MKPEPFQLGNYTVCYYNNILRYTDNSAKHKYTHSIYLPTLSWCIKVIEDLKTNIAALRERLENKTIGKWGAQWQLDRDEKRLYEWESIQLPRVLEIEKRKNSDTEVDYMTDQEIGKTCGEQFGKMVKGPDNLVASLNLRQGDRFICNYNGTKYIFIKHTGHDYHPYRTVNKYLVLNDEYKIKVTIKDGNRYQKLRQSFNFFN